VNEIDDVKVVIQKYFEIQDVRWTQRRAEFFCRIDPSVLGDRFDALRKELIPAGYIPAVSRRMNLPGTANHNLEELADTRELRGMLERIRNEDQPEVRQVWLERFLELARCPTCGDPIKQSPSGGPFCRCTQGSGPGGSSQSGPAGEEIVISVHKKPSINFRSTRVNLVMFILTIITTTLTGATFWVSHTHHSLADNYWQMIYPTNLAFGALFFSGPLMVILGTHELGHYFMARHHKVAASLPFFIPLPPGISPLGTFGALISLREPMPNKKVLFDIGIAGPVAGLLVAIPVILMGFAIAEEDMEPALEGGGPNVRIGYPLLMQGLYVLVQPEDFHPLIFAGWVGILVTALNLLPIGQLDGGHIVRALLGERSKYASYAALLFAVIGGLLYFQGWLFLVLIITLLGGARHPPPLEDISKLDLKRTIAGGFAVLLLLVCIHPAPLSPIEYHLDAWLEDEDGMKIGPDGLEMSPGESVNISIIVENEGEYHNTFDITVKNGTLPEEWNVTLERDNITVDYDSKSNADMARGIRYGRVILNITAPTNATIGKAYDLPARVISQNETPGLLDSSKEKKKLNVHVVVVENSMVRLETEDAQRSVPAGNSTRFDVNLTNPGRGEVNVSLLHTDYTHDLWTVNISATEFHLEPGGTDNFTVDILSPRAENETLVLYLKAMIEGEWEGDELKIVVRTVGES